MLSDSSMQENALVSVFVGADVASSPCQEHNHTSMLMPVALLILQVEARRPRHAAERCGERVARRAVSLDGQRGSCVGVVLPGILLRTLFSSTRC